MNIITLTLNPAFDVHCFAEDFQPFHENLAQITESDAGGKGVNISRALTANGVENTALVVLGEDNGDSFKKALSDDGLDFRAITVKGRIRENITLHTNGKPETRISFAGFTTDDSLLLQVEKALAGKIGKDTVVTLTGRNPAGVSINGVKAMLSRLQKQGAHIVIDSRSFGKEDLLSSHPWLIKPNEEEIGMYTDLAVHDIESAARAVDTLRQTGIENVMLSLGKRGALLAANDGIFLATPPSVTALSTIGAGDSSIAGFLAAAKSGYSHAEMLRTAVCYGTAACLTEGTRPPRKEDVLSLLPKISVERLK